MSDDIDMRATTSHHLLIDGPPAALDAARQFWLGTVADIIRANTQELQGSDRPGAAPHAPACWLTFDGRGAQWRAVRKLAELYPAISATLIWFDMEEDAGERILFADGRPQHVEKFQSYEAAYEAVHGEPDPDLAD